MEISEIADMPLPADYLLSLAGRPVRSFDGIIQSFMGPMGGVRCHYSDWLGVAAQFVGDHAPWRFELCDQPLKKPLCCLGVSPRLHKNIEDVFVRVDGTPKQVFLTSNWDDDFVKMLFVVGTRVIAPDEICEIRTKAIDPQPDCFPADNHTPFSHQVLDMGGAHCEAVISPNSVRHAFAPETKAFHARHAE